jgi:hypothetical protein
MQDKVGNALAKELAKECRSIGDIEEKLKELFKDTLSRFWKQKWSTI